MNSKFQETFKYLKTIMEARDFARLSESAFEAACITSLSDTQKERLKDIAFRAYDISEDAGDLWSRICSLEHLV